MQSVLACGRAAARRVGGARSPYGIRPPPFLYFRRGGDALAAGEDATILIGPEGDFSPEEVELAVKAGYRPVSLGSSRLRTETAALVACHTFILKNEI